MEKSQVESGDLEASLLQLFQNHHHASHRLRKHNEKTKKDTIRHTGQVSDLLVDTMNSGVQQSFINEKRIELEIRALAINITRFIKQTDQWLTATHAINTAIKEIGDFENWIRTMEFDCKSINAAIRNIHQE